MYAPISSLILLAGLLLAANGHSLPDDQYQPIEILSNAATHDERNGLSSYKGNVVVNQGSMTLQADTVSVTRDASFVEASGNPARFSQQPDPEKPVIEAQANRIHYAMENGKIELQGNARLQQGDARIASDHIVYHIADQVFSAGNTQSSSDQPAQRVQVIIPAQPRPEPEASKP